MSKKGQDYLDGVDNDVDGRVGGDQQVADVHQHGDGGRPRLHHLLHRGVPARALGQLVQHLKQVEGSLGGVANEEDEDDSEEERGHGGVPRVARRVQEHPRPHIPGNGHIWVVLIVTFREFATNIQL